MINAIIYSKITNILIIVTCIDGILLTIPYSACKIWLSKMYMVILLNHTHLEGVRILTVILLNHTLPEGVI